MNAKKMTVEDFKCNYAAIEDDVASMKTKLKSLISEVKSFNKQLKNLDDKAYSAYEAGEKFYDPYNGYKPMFKSLPKMTGNLVALRSIFASYSIDVDNFKPLLRLLNCW